MPKKILLADDSITIQKVVELTFSDGDYEVIATNNGAKAIQRLAEVRPDIILSDIIMPEKNGYEVCEYVKSHPEFRHIPVILLTGTFEPFDPDRAEKAGCDAVVTKPFESQSLIHKVEDLIAQSSARPQEAFTSEEDAFASTAPTPLPSASPFSDDAIHTAPTYEIPAFRPPDDVEPASFSSFESSSAGADDELDSSPFGSSAHPVTAEAPATDPFAGAAAESPFEQEPASPSFHEHTPDLFDVSAQSDDAGAIPLSPPLSWGIAATTAGMDAAEEAPLYPAEAYTESAPSWGEEPAPAAEENPASTQMIPKLSLDEYQQIGLDDGQSAAPEASSPFEESSGETKMIPKLSFDDLQRANQESQNADAAAPLELEQQHEAEVIPFEREAAQEEPEIDRMPTSESPFEQEFEMPSEVESIPLRDDRAAASDEAEEMAHPEALASEAPSAEPVWSPKESQQYAAQSEEAVEAPFGDEEEEEPVEALSTADVAEQETERMTPPAMPLWSATEPESISPQPPAFTEPEPLRLAPEPEPLFPAAAEPLSAPQPSAAPAAAASLDPSALSDEVIDRIARRVVELMSEKVVQNIAWEVIPDMAEMAVKERIRQLENEG